MFKIGVAHSLTADVHTAAQSLVDKALHDLDGASPSAALLFSTFGSDHHGLLLGLTSLLPDCPVVGGSSNGEVSHQQGYRVGSCVLIVFASDTVTIRAGVLRDLTFDDGAFNQDSALRQFHAQGIATGWSGKTPTSNSNSPAMGLIFPDGIGLDGESIVQLFNGFFPSTRLFGGATAENFTLGPTDQFFNEEVLHRAVPYLLFYGPLRFHWSVTEGLGSGWRAVGERLDAQCEGKWLKTISGRPAVEHLASRYRLEGGLLSVCHPLVIFPDQSEDVHYFRDFLRYNQGTGALESLQLLPEECQVQLTQPDPVAVLEVSRKNIHQALAHFPGSGHPAGALWFSCVSRALVLEADAPKEFDLAVDILPTPLPVAGFYTYGEIAPMGATGSCGYHSSVLVTLLLGEEPGTIAGISPRHRQFSATNLEHENSALRVALSDSRAQVERLLHELKDYRALGRIAAHSKTELNTHYRALALDLVCEVLDSQFDDFKRLALKGNPLRLNRSGLARLVHVLYMKKHGQPFPLSTGQLARLLAQED